VHVRGVRRQGRRAARDGHRLDLIQQHDRGQTVVGQQRDVVGQELDDLLLALAVFRGHQAVGVDLDETGPVARGKRRGPVGHTAGQRRLAGAGGSVQQDQAVAGGDYERQRVAQVHRQEHLVEQTILERRVDDHLVPRVLRLQVRQHDVRRDAVGHLHRYPLSYIDVIPGPCKGD